VAVANELSPLDRLVTPAGDVALSGQSAIHTFSVAANGTYTFTVYNAAGLHSTYSIEVSNIDKDPPTIAHTTSIPAGQFTTQDVDISLALGDALSGLHSLVTPSGTVSLNSHDAEHIYIATHNGTFEFTLLDNAGNRTTYSVDINVIDRVAPMVVIEASPQQWHNQPSVTLQVTTTDDFSGVYYIRLPDGTTHYGDAAEFEIFGNGNFVSRATDRAGNIAEVAFAYGWFDRTPPTITYLRFTPVQQPLFARLLSWFGFVVSNQAVRMEIGADDTPGGSEGQSGVEWVHHRVLADNGEVMRDWTATDISADMPEIGRNHRPC